MKKIIITGQISDETSDDDDEIDTLYDLLPQIGITKIQIEIEED